MSPMKPYVVKKGEYLTQIAHRCGLSEDEIWNDPKNADLKADRPNPNVLCPGDVIYVPENEDEGLDVQEKSSNSFVADVPKIPVKVLLLDEDGEPIAGKKYWLHGLDDDPPEDRTTGGDGEVEFEAPVTLKEVFLVLEGDEVARRILIGHLDPSDEESGAWARLTQLGYLPDEEAASWGLEDDDTSQSDELEELQDRAFQQALRAFQEDQKLEVTGELDEDTADALEKAHGN